jgi:uncharacterized protein YlxP (DUF503 family)
MIVGSCRIELFIPESGSLKGKRHVLKGIKDRIRNRFNVSVAEVDHQDLWQRASIGVAVVSTDYAFIDQTIAQILNLIHQEPRVHVLDYQTERR